MNQTRSQQTKQDHNEPNKITTNKIRSQGTNQDHDEPNKIRMGYNETVEGSGNKTDIPAEIALHLNR
jgi:hypothetical protein